MFRSKRHSNYHMHPTGLCVAMLCAVVLNASGASAHLQGVAVTSAHAKVTKAIKSKVKRSPTRATKSKTVAAARTSGYGPVPAPSSNASAASIPPPSKMEPSMTVPPARDPQMAVQEEFDAALVANTVVTWDLFIARHAGNSLLPRAQSELAKLRGPRP